jgi:PTH1 family peptidyl-tRNA hydrolase
LRIGIGHPGVKSEVANWVLNKPSPDQRVGIEQALERSLKAADDLRAGAFDKAMRKIHTAKAPKPKPTKPTDITAGAPKEGL